MRELKQLIYLMTASVILALPGFSFAAVPHGFSAGDPIRASEMNSNFDNLDTRVDAAAAQNSVLDFSGYGTPFAADDATRNVVVLRRDLGNGETSYTIRSRYANSSEQISIDGILTIRPFIANYANVRTDSLGNITSVSNYIEAPDTANYIDINVETSSYDTTTLVKTVVDDNLRENWDCTSGAIVHCAVTATLNADGSFVDFYDWNTVRALGGPYTFNGMTFNDVRMESFTGNRNSFRLRAKGIGEIFRDFDNGNQRFIFYYRVDGGTGGSLAGTPFASGGPLDGLFF